MWIVFTLATTLLWGLAELFYKKGAHEDEPYSHLKICVFVGSVMGFHAVITLLTGNIGFTLSDMIKYLPVSAFYILSMTLSFFGMRFIEESISDPIENTSGALCSLLCVLILKDRLSWISATAILIILSGILGIGFLEHRGNQERKRKIGKKLAVIAFCMPFCYAILDAVGSFLDVFYLEIETTPLKNITPDTIEQVANTAYELTFFVFSMILLGFLKFKKVPIGFKGQGDKILAAVCETAGQMTYVYAMSGNGAVAAPIISSVCVVSLLFSRLFLKEKLTGKQYFFIALVIVGILILAIAEGE